MADGISGLSLAQLTLLHAPYAVEAAVSYDIEELVQRGLLERRHGDLYVTVEGIRLRNLKP